MQTHLIFCPREISLSVGILSPVYHSNHITIFQGVRRVPEVVHLALSVSPDTFLLVSPFLCLAMDDQRETKPNRQEQSRAGMFDKKDHVASIQIPPTIILYVSVNKIYMERAGAFATLCNNSLES